jgi:hypothetical protein
MKCYDENNLFENNFELFRNNYNNYEDYKCSKAILNNYEQLKEL